MILTALLLTTLFAGAAVVTLLSIFWKKIVEGIKKVWAKLTETFRIGLQGVKALLSKKDNTFQNTEKYYSYNKQEEKWQEAVSTRPIDPSEIPDEFKVQFQEYSILDISNRFRQELELKH